MIRLSHKFMFSPLKMKSVLGFNGLDRLGIDIDDQIH